MSFPDQVRLFEAAGPDAVVGEALALGGLSMDELVYEDMAETCQIARWS